MANWKSFEELDIRTGKIVKVEFFIEAIKPAYKLWIDFGPLGIKQSSAQITERYTPESLKNIDIVAVVNFPPKQIANFISECLVLGVYTESGVVLLQPGIKTDAGLKIG